MKNILLLSFGFCMLTANAQNEKINQQIEQWQKAIINIEAKTFLQPAFISDSIIYAAKANNAKQEVLDSLFTLYNSLVKIITGTALYVADGNEHFLITAKHVLFDSDIVKTKHYKTTHGIEDWSGDYDAIYPALSIRTPYEYAIKNKKSNNLVVGSNNFVKAVRPFKFFSDSTGDGIAILSLQEKNFKSLDSVLSDDGYIPIQLSKISSTDNQFLGNTIYTLGFPEIISIIGRMNYDAPVQLFQSPELVESIYTEGKIAFFTKILPYFFVDLTITPGSSGSPIIENNKLIGIVSGVNPYEITTDNFSEILKDHLYGIGHLVKIIKVQNLITYIKIVEEQEKHL